MGRFRTFSKHKTIDSSEQNQKLDSLSFYTFARTKDTDKDDDNFKIDYDNCNVKMFKSYDTFLKFTRGMYMLSPSLNFCCDTPFNLDQGIKSTIHLSQFHNFTHHCKLYPCNCNCWDLMLDVDKCKELKGRLYPYGDVNNNKLGRQFKFPTNINICCCKDKMCCPEYIMCRCSNSKECRCSRYQEMFPTQYKFSFKDKK